MRTFVLGDIHGAYKALLDVFERSGFNKDNDRLIVLGDVADGWSQVKQCIDKLMEVKNLIYVMGNHDVWLLDWLIYKESPDIWLSQGGRASIKSFAEENDHQKYINFFNKSFIFFKEDENIFVHGGFPYNTNVEDNHQDVLLWDRSLTRMLRMSFDNNEKLTKYDEVFIGHTSTEILGSNLPVSKWGVTLLDTGAGYSGKLTIMDLATKDYWQSDPVKQYYPDEKGR